MSFDDPGQGAREDRRATRRGALLAVGAYLCWGLFPLYFKAVAHVPALQVLAHRVVWALVVVGLAVVVARRGSAVWSVLGSPRRLLGLTLSATVLAVNWGVFIYAVATGRVLQASLGYFINPLVSVVLGVIVFGERLSAPAWLAVGLAAIGVGIDIIHLGTLPWIAMVLAVSFAAYGVLHKREPIDTLVGLCIETAVLAPLAAVYLLILAVDGSGAFGTVDARTDGLLILAGPITALPLLLFVAAAGRITLSTLGLVQYLTPTAHLLLAVLLFGETLSADQWLAFGLIWGALGLYAVDALRRRAAIAHR